jgi:hypothetical protein
LFILGAGNQFRTILIRLYATAYCSWPNAEKQGNEYSCMQLLWSCVHCGLDVVNLLDYICRDMMELRQAECRAWAQVEHLKVALDEHSLELRVKAANEAEAVCQQRLTAAEAEIAGLRQRLDALDRFET